MAEDKETKLGMEQEAAPAQEIAFVRRTSGKIERWVKGEEDKDTVTVTSFEGKKVIHKTLSRTEYEKLNAPGPKDALELLTKIREAEIKKAILGTLDVAGRDAFFRQIQEMIQEMSKGDYEATRAFLVRTALEKAEESRRGEFSIESATIDELRARIKEQRDLLDRRIEEQEKRKEELAAELEKVRKSGNEGQIRDLEVQSLTAFNGLANDRRAREGMYQEEEDILQTVEALDEFVKEYESK